MTTNPPAQVPKVIVITPWYGGTVGGVAVVTESLVHSLISDGVPCAVIEMLSDGWRLQKRRGQSGEEIVGMCLRDPLNAKGLISKIGVKFRAGIAERALRALLPADGRPCVVHMHYSMPEYELFVDLCKRWRIPMVTTFHGSDLAVNMQLARTSAVTLYQVAQSQVVTTVSEALRKTALGLFPAIGERAFVVHNAVPPSFVDAAAASAAAAPSTRDIDVLFVGNLIPLKGVDILLRAWPQVLAALPNATLTIAGTGSASENLTQLAQTLRVEKSVTFLGRQSRAELPTLYRRAKILAVPSRSEALGVVILEAQLCGAAIVASETGGIPEIVEHEKTGLLVQSDNAAQFGAALVRMLSDSPLRATLVETGRAKVSQHFNAAHIGMQYQQLYQRAVRAAAAMAST